MTEADFRELVDSFGKVLSLKVVTSDQGRSKGFGFVSFETPEEAQQVSRLLMLNILSAILLGFHHGLCTVQIGQLWRKFLPASIDHPGESSSLYKKFSWKHVASLWKTSCSSTGNSIGTPDLVYQWALSVFVTLEVMTLPYNSSHFEWCMLGTVHYYRVDQVGKSEITFFLTSVVVSLKISNLETYTCLQAYATWLSKTVFSCPVMQ